SELMFILRKPNLAAEGDDSFLCWGGKDHLGRQSVQIDLLGFLGIDRHKVSLIPASKELSYCLDGRFYPLRKDHNNLIEWLLSCAFYEELKGFLHHKSFLSYVVWVVEKSMHRLTYSKLNARLSV